MLYPTGELCFWIAWQSFSPVLFYNEINTIIPEPQAEINADEPDDFLNINDLPTSKFNEIIYSTSKEPYFYKFSIIENLKIVCDDKNKIIKLLKKFNLFDKLLL